MVEEALQHRTYQDALSGKRMASHVLDNRFGDCALILKIATSAVRTTRARLTAGGTDGGCGVTMSGDRHVAVFDVHPVTSASVEVWQSLREFRQK
jgi:hypothetical protein